MAGQRKLIAEQRDGAALRQNDALDRRERRDQVGLCDRTAIIYRSGRSDTAVTKTSGQPHQRMD